MKNLLNWNNFVAVTEGKNESYDLDFHVDGLLMVIRGAEMYDRPLIDGVIQHPLKYWYEKQNIERAIEQAEEVDIVEEVEEVTTSSDLLEEIADITQELENTNASLVKRLDNVALTLEQGGTNTKEVSSHAEHKNEVALTAKQLADLGEMLLINKEMLEFQNHALGLVKSPQEANGENLIIHYDELYRLTDDMYRVNQGIAKRIDTAAFLLLESADKDEIDAYYNK